MSFPLRLLLRFLVTVTVVAALSTFLPQYVFVAGGVKAFFLIGAVLAVMNVLVRPLLHLIALPLKLFATILALVLVNGGFVWILVRVLDEVNPAVLRFEILGGWQGWAVVAFILGLTHWLMKELLR
jgi:uncharacterized membrane protein YvlD (DUF360 family)